jgi:phosphate uptake regulator
MQTRKAQLTGGSTYTVSLPKEWAKGVDLETGDTLRLYTRERSLIVEPTATETDPWTVSVDVDEVPADQVRRILHALYTAGFDRITLTASTGFGSNRRVITTTARRFIGLETLESTDTRITLQSLLDSSTVSIDESAVQLERVALSMHEDAVTALLEGDGVAADEIVDRDDQVDRLYAMISRHHQRSIESLQETDVLTLTPAELHDYQTTARQLERVADHAVKLATLTSRFETPPTEDFADAIREHAATARAVVEQAASTIIGDAEIDTAHAALDDRDAVIADLEALERRLHEADVDESHLVALAIDSVARTAEYGANIAETSLQAAARNDAL